LTACALSAAPVQEACKRRARGVEYACKACKRRVRGVHEALALSLSLSLSLSHAHTAIGKGMGGLVAPVNHEILVFRMPLTRLLHASHTRLLHASHTVAPVNHEILVFCMPLTRRLHASHTHARTHTHTAIGKGMRGLVAPVEHDSVTRKRLQYVRIRQHTSAYVRIR
jgi:hypothetical protein